MLAGDESAWREAVAVYAGLMAAAARRAFAKYDFSASETDVQDAAAEAWKNLLDNDRRLLRQCAQHGNLLQMLYTLARNRAIDIIRAAARGAAALEQQPDQAIEQPPDCATGDEEADLQRVRKAFDELSEKQRTVLRLFYLQGKKYREIEKLTGIPVNTIGSIIARALAKIRETARKVER